MLYKEADKYQKANELVIRNYWSNEVLDLLPVLKEIAGLPTNDEEHRDMRINEYLSDEIQENHHNSRQAFVVSDSFMDRLKIAKQDVYKMNYY